MMPFAQYESPPGHLRAKSSINSDYGALTFKRKACQCLPRGRVVAYHVGDLFEAKLKEVVVYIMSRLGATNNVWVGKTIPVWR